MHRISINNSYVRWFAKMDTRSCNRKRVYCVEAGREDGCVACASFNGFIVFEADIRKILHNQFNYTIFCVVVGDSRIFDSIKIVYNIRVQIYNSCHYKRVKGACIGFKSIYSMYNTLAGLEFVFGMRPIRLNVIFWATLWTRPIYSSTISRCEIFSNEKKIRMDTLHSIEHICTYLKARRRRQIDIPRERESEIIPIVRVNVTNCEAAQDRRCSM